MTDVRTFVWNNTRGAYLVIGEGERRDELTETGRWLASDAPAECLP